MRIAADAAVAAAEVILSPHERGVAVHHPLWRQSLQPLSSAAKPPGITSYSLKHFEEALESLPRISMAMCLEPFRLLVTRPGLLASNFLAGRRRSQMGPVQVSVVCNVIYFLVQPFAVAFRPSRARWR